MSKKLSLGVLGLGEGRSIMSAVLNSPQWELGNICDLNEALCVERCEEFDFPRYTLDYQDMLDDSSIDVIGIYTPDQLHATHIVQALEAGKHVICTKPLMVGLKEANHLIEVQKKSGKHVFVGQSSRFFESTLAQRKDFEEGKHGELVAVETHYISDSRWFLERDWSHEAGFSWMYNFLVHALDLAIWYLPQVETVYCAGTVSENSKEHGLAVPDTMQAVLTDKSGLHASIKGMYATPTFPANIVQPINCTLRGSKGISQGGSELSYLYKFNGEGQTKRVDYSELYDYYYRFEGTTHHAGEYQNYIEYFADTLEQGETPYPDLKEGIRTVAVLEALERSMKTNQLVKVSDILDEAGVQL